MNYVYLLRCADGTLYGGWTNDLSRRLAAHNTGTAGAKYTRSRRPVTLIYCEAYATKGEAMHAEAMLKKLTRPEKLRLADTLAAPGDPEWLTIYDAKRTACGRLPRARVHRCGLLHRVAHLHVFETRERVPGVWLQQRAPDKRAAPLQYDWAATGHIAAGENPLAAALRETREECGLLLEPSALTAAGEQRVRTVYAPDFVDDELAVSYAYFSPAAPPFRPGPEVQRMVWVARRDLTRALADGVPLPAVAQDGTADTISPEKLARGIREWRAVQRALAVHPLS